jgi:hypothetical protein
MAKQKVRVTMFADPIEVEDHELPGLRSQGLLIEDENPAAPPKTAAAKPSGKTTEGA